MRKPLTLLFVLLALALACKLPVLNPAPAPTATATATQLPVTETPLAYPTATPLALGTPGNPLILALPPAIAIPEVLDTGKSLAESISKMTGYTIVLVQPESYTDLVAALGAGNAHFAWLTPFAYADAYQKGFAVAGMASQRFESDYYGAQFIANVRGNFEVYVDPLSGQNTADAQTALAQFEGYKPCWDDPQSAAGYVIPFGFLNESGVTTKPAAFVEGHSTVVRSVYAQGICDFGATVVDARQSPAIQQDLPDVNQRVQVIWRIDPVIPYDVVVFAAAVPQEMRIVLSNSLIMLMATEEGSAAIKSLYLVEGLKPVDDTFYEPFRHYLEASGLDLETLVK